MVVVKGILSRVSGGGVGYFVEATTKQLFAFTFDKIKGYRGETPRELGLRPGLEISAELDNSEKRIKSVQVVR